MLSLAMRAAKGICSVCGTPYIPCLQDPSSCTCVIDQGFSPVGANDEVGHKEHVSRNCDS